MQSVNIYMQLPVLIVVISLVYAGTRYDEWGSILVEAFRWGSRMALFLASIGLALYLLAEYGVVVLWIGLVIGAVALVFYLVALVMAPFYPKIKPNKQ